MKLIIAGGRDFDDYDLLETECSEFIYSEGKRLGLTDRNQFEIVVGGARGADSLGKEFAQRNLIRYKLFKPDWDGLGKRAGFVRNQEMGDYATHLIAFDTGGKGTAHMVGYMKKLNKIIRVVDCRK